MKSDAELIRLTLSQGSHYYGILIGRYSDYVFGLCMRLTAGDRTLAEEISQQAFLKAFLYLKRYDVARDFKNWLSGIVVNCFKDVARQEAKHSGATLEKGYAYEPDLEENRDFFRLIRNLSIDDRTIVTLRFVYDFTVDEIAEILGIKSGTIKSRISRSLEKMK